MTKSDLRRTFLARRRALSQSETAERSLRVRNSFFSNAQVEGVAVLHCFLSIEKFNEVDTSGIIETVWSKFPNTRVAVPKVNSSTGELDSVFYTPDTPMAESDWGIREPAGGSAVEPGEIGMVLVPGLVFDRAGHRVGYGKGYYDRFLAKCRPECLKIGLSLFPLIDPIDDIHDGDVRLNACITPDKTFHFIQ